MTTYYNEHIKEYAKYLRKNNFSYEKISNLIKVNIKTVICWIDDRQRLLRNYSHNKYDRCRNFTDLKYRCKQSLSKIKAQSKKLNYKECISDLQEIINKFTNYCAICGIKEQDCTKQLHMDHCHKTGKIRGFLCQQCNNLLGSAKDNIEILTQAIDYLKQNSNLK